MSILIQPASEIYLESYQRCLDTVAKERRYLGLTSAPSLEAIQNFFERIILLNGAQYYAINDKSDVIGWCDIVPNPRELFAHVASLGMGLLPEYRGRGIGRKLMEACFKDARATGIERVELEVYADNHNAIRLYEKAGFVHEGVKVKSAKIDGRYIDVVMMAKFI